MNNIDKKGLSLVWLVILIAIVGVAVAGYFVTRSDMGSNKSTANQDSNAQKT